MYRRHHEEDPFYPFYLLLGSSKYSELGIGIKNEGTIWYVCSHFS